MDDEKGQQRPRVKYSCPSWSTFLVYSSIVVVTVSLIVPLEFKYGLFNLYMRIGAKLPEEISIREFLLQKLGYMVINKDLKKNERILSKEELKKYSGEADKIYLAILGKVFDVTKGRRHYGKDGGYSFFAGIDGSRAFVTGEFNEKGLVDNIDGLPPHNYVSLMEWSEMYHKDYVYVGKVEGFFYDENGNPKEGFHDFNVGYELGKKMKAKEEEDKTLFPECNSIWTPESGAEVWCAQGSGGIQRNWLGYPRLYFKVGQTASRCACVKEEHFSDVKFKEYKECASTARRCKVQS